MASGSKEAGSTPTHFNSDSTVHGTGTWTVKQFVGFDGEILKAIVGATSTEGEELTFMQQISIHGVTIWTRNVAARIFSPVVSGWVTFTVIEAVGGVVMAANALALVAPWLVVIGPIACIRTAVILVRQRQ